MTVLSPNSATVAEFGDKLTPNSAVTNSQRVHHQFITKPTVTNSQCMHIESYQNRYYASEAEANALMSYLFFK